MKDNKISRRKEQGLADYHHLDNPVIMILQNDLDRMITRHERAAVREYRQRTK
jgi:hypothetical protein